MDEKKLSSDVQADKQNFLSCLLSYASGGKQKLILSVILSFVSIMAGLVPYYCFLPCDLPVHGWDCRHGRDSAMEPSGVCCLCSEGALLWTFYHGKPLCGIPYPGGITEPCGRAFFTRTAG